MKEKIMKAYTYYIAWTEHDTHYYGVRTAAIEEPHKDLWHTYFTSSKYVKDFREKNGEPDIVEIRKIFDNREKALLWETQVLTKLNVRKNSKWLNRYDTTYNGVTGPKPEGFGEKISKALSGIPKSEKHRASLSKSFKGKYTWVTNGISNKQMKQTERNDFLNKNPLWWHGYTTDVETRKKMSVSAKRVLAEGKRTMPTNWKSGKDHHFYGKSHTDKTKHLISKKRKQYYIHNPDKKPIGKKNGMYGKHHSEETRKAQSERTKKMKWYNDGNTNLYVKDGDSIPSGFIRGRITGWNTHPTKEIE